MKYFKTNNEVMAIDKGQEFLVKPEWLEITEEEAMLITNPPKTEEELESERVQAIKSKAGEIINQKYNIYWQLNHPRVDVTFTKEYEWIDAVRAMSNELEADVSKTVDDFIMEQIKE